MPKPVLFVLDCLYADASGGTETQFLRVLRSSSELGIEATVVFLRDQPVHKKIDWPREPHLLGIGSLLSLRLFTAIRDLEAIIDREGACLVQSYFDDAAILCAFLKRRRPDIEFVCGHGRYKMLRSRA